MGPQTILVDGYNVIRNTPGLAAAERVSLETGRETLVKLLASRYRHTPHRVIVVFDGDGETESSYPLPGMARSRIIFSRAGESADQVIARLSQQELAKEAECVVVSDDLEVRSSVQSAGGHELSVRHLAEKLNEPSRYQRRQYRYRAYLRRQWEKDKGES